MHARGAVAPPGSRAMPAPYVASLLLCATLACGDGQTVYLDTGATPVSCEYEPATGPVLHVATTGSDEGGDGSEERPFASITHALRAAVDGSTVLVHPGTYEGSIRLPGAFAEGVTVRAAQRYAARLRSKSGATMFCYSCKGITIEGFDIAHAGPGAGPLVVHIGGPEVERITVRNNVIHDSYDNDLLKVNNGASYVIVERNVFYNQQGRDEHIDANSVRDVLIQDNVFFNDFAGSGRENRNDTSSYIVIKDSNGPGDGILGAERVVVRRNVFLNWEGSSAHNFVLIGEDGADYIEAHDVLIENNVLLGNSDNALRAPFGVKSGRGITFRNNSVVGDLPSLAFAMRLNVENRGLQNQDIHFYNNIWSDPTGTMSPFSASPPGETRGVVLDGNLYWNGDRDLPHDDGQLVNPSLDRNAVMGDPQLGDQRGVRLPVLGEGSFFADGSATPCEALDRLVEQYGTPGPESAALGAARADMAPAHDIRGRLRGKKPALGAVERR